MLKPEERELATLRCWECHGLGVSGMQDDCWKCGKTGRVFWVDGRTYPYTPEGEKRARADEGAA